MSYSDYFEKACKFVRGNLKYIGPYFLLPVAIVYLADYLKFILDFIQILAITSVLIFFGLALAGGVLGVQNKHDFLKYRFAEVFVPFAWGFKVMRWLLEEDLEG